MSRRGTGHMNLSGGVPGERVPECRDPESHVPERVDQEETIVHDAVEPVSAHPELVPPVERMEPVNILPELSLTFPVLVPPLFVSPL